MSKQLSQEGGMDVDKLKKHVELSQRIIERVAKIVKSLRNLGRSKDDDLLLEVPLCEILNDVEDVSRPMIEADGIKFDVIKHVDCGTIKLEANQAQLSQVLLNCLNNSQQAVRDLEDKWIQLDINLDGKILVIQVVDAGQGIPDEILPKLFTPFFTTKPPGEGTGIGLSISKKIIQRHGGQFYVGEGPNTNFTIELPAIHEPGL